MVSTVEQRKIVAIEQQQVTIPSFINWIAQDSDGSWWGYEVEPLQQHHGWYENEVGRSVKLFNSSANRHWQETLHRI